MFNKRHGQTRSNSRTGLEVWLAALKAANGIAMMFGVLGTKTSVVVTGPFLPAAPVHEQAVAWFNRHRLLGGMPSTLSLSVAFSEAGHSSVLILI